MVKNAKPNTYSIIIALVLLASVSAGVLVNLNRGTILNIFPMFKKSLKIKASIPYWEQKEATTSFQNNIKSFDYIQVFWYFISEEGDIKTYKYATEDRELINLAHDNNVKVLAIITNLPEDEGTTWDSKRIENILKNQYSREKHIRDIEQKINDLNLDGVIIDYESVDVSQKDKFSDFIENLSNTMHKQNKIVAVSVHPKTSDNVGLGKFQDWKKLIMNADHISIMSYGEHWDESPAGPIASISWLKEIINYIDKLGIPKDKIYLGVPLYGLKWNKSNSDAAEGLTYKNVEELISKYDLETKWDGESSSQYLNYSAEGNTFEVWFENNLTVEKKLELAQQAGFAGVSFWRLGGEDSLVWKTVSKFREN